ncbi:MAG: polysaccharide biosynthesis C-terminal domain-containing protein [Bacteroidales bacterium]|nr:polysaccharide biosynthesis C-terminal domain-containing protein [Bacteroidales bacterium]
MKAGSIKEHLKLSFIYTAAAAFTPVLQVLIQPVYEGKDKLGAVDFSQLAITELFTSLVFAIALFGMGNAIARFYYDHEPGSPTYHRMVSGIFSSILIRGLIIAAVAWALSDYIGLLFNQPQLRNFSDYGVACVVTGLGRAVNITAAALFRNEKKILSFILVSMGLGVFRTGFQLIGLFYFDMSFIGYINGSAIGTAIVTLMILIQVYRKSGISYDRKLMKEINRFAIPLTQYSVIVWALTYADRFMLEKFPVDLGIYNTAVTFAAGIAIVLQGLQGANQPEVFRVMKLGISKNQEEIRQYCNILLMQSMVIIVGAILPTMLYLHFFYETEVRQSLGLIALVFMRSILRTQFIIFSYPSYYLKKTRIFLLLNSAVMLVNILLNYLLIPVFLYYGAIAAGLIADLIMVAGIYYYQKRIAGIEWNLKKTIIFPLFIVIFTVIADVIRVNMGLNPFLTATLVTIVAFGGMIYLYKAELTTFIEKRWKRS